MPSKKVPLSHNQSKHDTIILDELTKLEEDKYLWIKIVITGILTALGAILVLFLIASVFNFFNFGFLLALFKSGLLLVLFSGVYFLYSGLSIWFGPSPQWAELKSILLKQTIKPKNLPESLQNGVKYSITGIVLLILAG